MSLSGAHLYSTPIRLTFRFLSSSVLFSTLNPFVLSNFLMQIAGRKLRRIQRLVPSGFGQEIHFLTQQPRQLGSRYSLLVENVSHVPSVLAWVQKIHGWAWRKR